MVIVHMQDFKILCNTQLQWCIQVYVYAGFSVRSRAAEQYTSFLKMFLMWLINDKIDFDVGGKKAFLSLYNSDISCMLDIDNSVGVSL